MIPHPESVSPQLLKIARALAGMEELQGAALGDGTFDLLLLHEHGIPLAESLNVFCAKYGSAGKFLAIRSLNWFENTQGEPDPQYLNGWTWTHVRSRMKSLARALVQ